ncbi:MAG: BatA domain-containing protein, partial [Gemmatimonadaceae bacterium]
MGLGFLAPLFAAGLLGVAIPLIVHLVHKERKHAVAFPSLMFVERSPYQHARRQRIRDWLLFLARALVIIILVAAFARPYFAPKTNGGGAIGGAREIVVLLDRSLSMRYGERWSRARAAATQSMNSVGARDRWSLIPFDTRASIVNDPAADAASRRTALDSLATTDAGTRLAPAVTLARRVLGASTLPIKELVVISDYQRSGWDLGNEVQMPSGTKITPVDVSAGEVQDRSVRAVETRRELTPGAAPSDNDRVIVSARLVNIGPAAKGVGAALEINGRQVERRSVDLPTDGGTTLSFAPVAVASGGMPARVVLDADKLPADDAYHFLLDRAPTVGVLIVDHVDAPSERGLFVARALGIGDHPAFDIRTVRSDRATKADLDKRQLVVLNDAGIPPGIGGAQLAQFVRSGGGLLTALGEHSSGRDWPVNGKLLLPGEVGNAVERLGAQGAVLGYLDRSHPALSVFGAARSGDLSVARFFRYRALQATDGVLARFDDGQPALVEQRLGSGRVLTWASSFDGYWNDLPRQAVFLPFVHQLARYAASYRERRDAWHVAESIDLRDATSQGVGAVRATTSAERYAIISPRGARLAVGGPDAPGALEAREAGFYEVRHS